MLFRSRLSISNKFPGGAGAVDWGLHLKAPGRTRKGEGETEGRRRNGREKEKRKGEGETEGQADHSSELSFLHAFSSRLSFF